MNRKLETLNEWDGIRVTTKSGNVYELVNLEITDKTLIGKNFRNGHKIVVPFEAIQKLKESEVSGAAVGLLLVGTMLLDVCCTLKEDGFDFSCPPACF